VVSEHPSLAARRSKVNAREAQSISPSDRLKPMMEVNWYDAVIFCNRLSERCGLVPWYEAIDFGDLDEFGKLKEGKQIPGVRAGGGNGYRLASEREWEWACRAGSRRSWSFGGDPLRLSDYAAFNAGTTSDVAAQCPAGNGVFDMHGNAYEWLEDLEENSTSRVLRGGSFGSSNPDDLRSAIRYNYSPDFRGSYFGGFRISRTK
ncbi:MAG: formylglycine-generating enzyme family protein, partial [Planctomycetaceae bacterium]